jgi:hypothetical protein
MTADCHGPELGRSYRRFSALLRQGNRRGVYSLATTFFQETVEIRALPADNSGIPA